MKEDTHNELGSDLFGLGGLFKGIEKIVDLAKQLEEKGGLNSEAELNLDHIRKGMKGVYGFTVKSAIGGTPKVETFGNITKTPSGPKVNDEREPITDLFDEDDAVIIIAEMPGVEEGDVTVEICHDILDISARSSNKYYHKEILLPIPSDSGHMQKKYINGILEIRISK